MRELLATPAIAIAAGLLVGLSLLLPIFLGHRRLTDDRVEVGLAIAMGSVFGGLLVALGALFGYRALAPAGVVWFGPSLVAGFVLALGAFAVRAVRWMR